MKIKRYQRGGLYYTPFFRDSVKQSTQQNVPATASKKEENFIQKEIVDVLKENGLPSDVDLFLKITNTFLNKGASIWGSDADYDLSDLVKIQSMANKVRHNAELHQKAVERLYSEDSGSEAAITNRGQIYVIGEDGLKTVSSTEYKNNMDKYQVLTNADLITLRESDENLSYRSDILNDLSNSVGMNSIMEQINKTISEFGTYKSEQSTSRYTYKEKQQIEDGLQALLSLGPDGYHSLDETISASDQGYKDAESMEAALKYLYSTLGQSMKNTLNAKAAVDGTNAIDFLQQAIILNTNHEYSREISPKYIGDAVKVQGGGNGSSSPKQIEMSRVESIVTGQVTDITPITIHSSQGHTGLTINAQLYGQFQDRQGDQIGMGTMRDVLKRDQLGSNIMMNSISIGDQLVNEVDLNSILYDGTSSIARTMLPIDKQEYAATGKIKPDLDAVRRFEIFLDWIEEGNGISENAVIMKQQELGLNLQKTPNGWTFSKNDCRPFLLANGYTSSKAVDVDKESNWLYRLSGNEGSKIFEIYRNYLNYGDETPSKNERRADFDGGWFGIGDAKSMFKGTIFMPLYEDASIATITTNNQLTSQDNYIDIFNRKQAARQQAAIKTNF